MRDENSNVFFPYFLAIAGFTAFAICTTANRAAKPIETDALITPASEQVITASRPEEATYRIDRILIDLVHGVHEDAGIPGAKDRAATSIVSIPFRADLDQNGTEDAFVILRRDIAARHLYYVGGALRRGDQFDGTDMFYVGDDITVGYSTFENGHVIMDYVERTGAKKSLLLKIVDGTVMDARETISSAAGID